jgi:alpha-L-fucosidase
MSIQAYDLAFMRMKSHLDGSANNLYKQPMSVNPMRAPAFLLFLFTLASTAMFHGCKPNKTPAFEPSWESLSWYEAPEWFRDAKFGIYMHWGPMVVAQGHGGWYGRHLYMPVNTEWGNDYEKHLQQFGHPSEFGYKDLIPLWKAENWKPDELVAFYKKIGARYIGCVAVHHDNFDCYNSSFQPWNSVNMGPKRDIVGEWRNAVVKQGLRFAVTSHSDRTWTWFQPAFGADSTGARKAVPYDGHMTPADGTGKWWEGYDPADLYTRPHGALEQADSAFLTRWFLRTRELIDNYRPDLVYFDGPIPLVGTNSPKGDDGRPLHEKYGLEIASHFYNASRNWHGGRLEAVMTIKSWGPGSIHDTRAAVMDVEKGTVTHIQERPWQTDTSIPGTWFYNGTGRAELTDTVIIHNLCDIVSKNGNMMLNVGLKPDGTLPENERAILENVGRWLAINGEAIYETRPWTVFGEGNTEIAEGEFKQNLRPYATGDVRFTTKGNFLYAIVMGWPENARATIRSLGTRASLPFGDISTVEMLGSTERIDWARTPEGLTVQLPPSPPYRFAFVLKIG